jgi:hypothetical protein
MPYKKILIEVDNSLDSDSDYRLSRDTLVLCSLAAKHYFKLVPCVQTRITIVLTTRKTVNSFKLKLNDITHVNIQTVEDKLLAYCIRIYTYLADTIRENFPNGCYISLKDSEGKTIKIQDKYRDI